MAEKTLSMSRSTDFLHYSWKPSQEMEMSTDVLIVLVITAIANGVPLALFREQIADGIVCVCLLALFHAICIVGAFATAKTDTAGARAMTKSLNGWDSNPFVRDGLGTKFYLFIHFGTGLSAVTYCLCMSNPLPKVGEALFYIEFLFLIHGFVIPFCVGVAHVLSSFRVVGKGWAAMNPMDGTVEMGEVMSGKSIEYVDVEKILGEGGISKPGLVFVMLLTLGFCVAPWFEFAKLGGADVANFGHYFLGGMASVLCFLSFMHFAFIISAMTAKLKKYGKVCKELGVEPLGYEEISRKTISEWWVRRTEFVHRTLPVLYYQISTIVVILFLATIPVVIQVAVTVNKGGTAMIYSDFSTLLAMFAGISIILGMLVIIECEVGVYTSTVGCSETFDYLILHVNSANFIPTGFKLPGIVSGDVTEGNELVELMNSMKAMEIYDPYASVMGIPVKPTFRNVLIGYLSTAVIALAGQAASE